MHVTARKTVPQSPEHVWSVLADHEGMSSWAPGLKATLTTVGGGERNGVGAVRRIDAPGPMPAIVEKIVTFEAGTHLGYDAVSGVPFRGYRGDVELRPAGSGTEILWSITIDPRLGLVEKPVLAVLARTLLGALVRRARATA